MSKSSDSQQIHKSWERFYAQRWCHWLLIFVLAIRKWPGTAETRITYW